MSLTTPERNLSNTPALKAIYDAMRAVENCGGSVELTAALNLIEAIGPHVHSLMDELEKLRSPNNRYTCPYCQTNREVNRLNEQNATLTAEVDRQMLLLKAVDHIAEGDDGWQKLTNECVSTMSVANLRIDRDQLCAEVERKQAALVELLAICEWKPVPIGPYGATLTVELPSRLDKAIAAARRAVLPVGETK